MNDLRSAIELIPEWALCYLINGDRTNLTEEDLKDIKGFYESYERCGCVIESIEPVEDEDNPWKASYSDFPAFGKPGNVVYCYVFYIQNLTPCE